MASLTHISRWTFSRLAHETGRTVREVALEMSGLEKAELEGLLDPAKLTGPWLMEAGT